MYTFICFSGWIHFNFGCLFCGAYGCEQITFEFNKRCKKKNLGKAPALVIL